MERREGRGEKGWRKGAGATVRPQRGHVLQVSEIRVTQSDKSQTTTRTAKQEETHDKLDTCKQQKIYGRATTGEKQGPTTCLKWEGRRGRGRNEKHMQNAEIRTRLCQFLFRSRG